MSEGGNNQGKLARENCNAGITKQKPWSVPNYCEVIQHHGKPKVIRTDNEGMFRSSSPSLGTTFMLCGLEFRLMMIVKGG